MSKRTKGIEDNCVSQLNITIALELSPSLPEDDSLLERWFSEPVKSVIIPANVFIANQKGYPVLPKKHQNFVKTLMKKVKSKERCVEGNVVT